MCGIQETHIIQNDGGVTLLIVLDFPVESALVLVAILWACGDGYLRSANSVIQTRNNYTRDIRLSFHFHSPAGAFNRSFKKNLMRLSHDHR